MLAILILLCAATLVLSFQITGIPNGVLGDDDPMSQSGNGYRNSSGVLEYNTLNRQDFKSVSWWSSIQWRSFGSKSVRSCESSEANNSSMQVPASWTVKLGGVATEPILVSGHIIDNTVYSTRVGQYGREYVVFGPRRTCVANVKAQSSGYSLDKYTLAVVEEDRMLFNSADECMSKSFDELRGGYYMRCVLTKLLDVMVCASMMNGGSTVVGVSTNERSQYVDIETIDNTNGTYNRFLSNLAVFYSEKAPLIGAAESVELTKVRKIVEVGDRRVLMGVTSFKHSFKSQKIVTPEVTDPSIADSTGNDAGTDGSIPTESPPPSTPTSTRESRNTSASTPTPIVSPEPKEIVKDSLLSIALCMVNKVRKRISVDPVKGHNGAMKYATWKASLCARCKMMEHSLTERCTVEDDVQWKQMAEKIGRYKTGGEILATLSEDGDLPGLEHAVQLWISSPGHYKIMTDPAYKYMGMAYAGEVPASSRVQKWAGVFIEGNLLSWWGSISPATSCPDPKY